MVVAVQREVALGPDRRSTGLESLLGIEDERQLFVVDLDEMERILGYVSVDRSHCRDRLADEAHRVVEHVPNVSGPILGRVVVLLPARYGARAVNQLVGLVRDDRPHPGQGLRPGHVDAPDARVRVWAPQNARVQHSRKPNIPRIRGSAGYTLVGIDARDVVPYGVHGPDLLAGLLRRSCRAHWAPPDPEVPAAASTASTIAL